MQSEPVTRTFPGLTGEMLRYAVIGACNVAIDVGLFSLGVWLTGAHSGWRVVAVATVSFVCAMANSYILNARWTFNSPVQPKVQLLPFALVSLVGLAISDGVLALLTSESLPWLGGGPSLLHVLGAKAVAILLSAAWNFMGYRTFVFGQQQERWGGFTR